MLSFKKILKRKRKSRMSKSILFFRSWKSKNNEPSFMRRLIHKFIGKKIEKIQIQITAFIK